MNKKNKDQEMLIVSEFFVESIDFESRYKSLKKTIKNLKKFKEVQLRGKIAEA